jgi:aryl-alcohol dehydrogenase-like predicted oxidoreductase
MAYGGADGFEEEAAALHASLDAGVDLFDTAAFYSAGASERRLGELVAGRDVVIASKFPGGLRFTAEDFPDELDASLARLGRPTIDLYQHHFPGRVSIPRLMQAMASAVEVGKVRAVGVSNYSADQMRQAHAALSERGIPLASNQVEYSLLHRRPETDGVLDACRELGVTLIAYTPLAGGMLTGKYSTENRPAGFYRRVLPRYRRRSLEAIGPVVGLLREIGDKHTKTPSQVALRWLIENPTVLPIPGAKNGRQAAANAGALTFSLTADEVEVLDSATRPWRS